jgi:hypothetical protein
MTRSCFPNALVCLSLAFLLPAATAVSADTAKQVVIGGTFIHTLRTPWGGLSPQKRADQIQQRLIAAMAQGPIFPKDITVGQVQDDWCVLLRGQRLLTADPMTAKQENASPQALAGQWATHLRSVLPDLTRAKRS